MTKLTRTEWEANRRMLTGKPPLPPTTQKPAPAPRKGPAPKTTAKRARKAPRPSRSRLSVSIDNPGAGNVSMDAPTGFAEPLPVFADATTLPVASPCQTCGGAVAPGSRFDSFGPWRRHQECTRVVGASHLRLRAAAAALGFGTLTIGDAALVPYTVQCYSQTYDQWNPPGAKRRTTRPPAYPKGTKTRDTMPWRHVDKRALGKAIKELPARRVEAGLVPTACVQGNCGLCGVVEAMGWVETDLTWPAGGQVPMCGECYPIYERHGSPTLVDDLRVVVAEAVTGMQMMMGEVVPPQVRAYVEVMDGDGTRFGFLPADGVENYRWARWTRWPGSAPTEHRAEARSRAAAAAAARLENTDTKERERVEALGTMLGFGVSVVGGTME